MYSSRSFTYQSNDRFKSYTVFIADHLLAISRGESEDSFKEWDLEDVPSSEAKREAAKWLAPRVDLSQETLERDWGCHRYAPYVDPAWENECAEEYAI